MRMHLDFGVDDLDPAGARVLAAGATKYNFQPNEHCHVYADPAGHPFCIERSEPVGGGVTRPPCTRPTLTAST